MASAELKGKIKIMVEDLIVKEGVDTFIFGSKSQFDDLCHTVVTELQKEHKNLRRIAYLCRHETGCLVGAGMNLSQKIKRFIGKEIAVKEYEEIKKCDRVNNAGRASYVERNQWMIDDSDVIIIRFDEDRKTDKQSGTAIAYAYAERKNKKVLKI